jgi:hypothetical protein
MSLGNDVDLEEFVTAKDDLSGADIKAVCTEAGLLALRERRMRVNKQDFSTARERVCLDPASIAHYSWGIFRCWIARRKVYQKGCICNSIMLSVFIIQIYIATLTNAHSTEQSLLSAIRDTATFCSPCSPTLLALTISVLQ